MLDNNRYYVVGYTYDLKDNFAHAPKTRHRCFETQQEAESYAEAVKAHALVNPDVRFVDLYINAPLPKHVYVAAHGYMPGPTIRMLRVCSGKVVS